MAYNVHSKISLTQLSLSHKSNKQNYKERKKQKSESGGGDDDDDDDDELL